MDQDTGKELERVEDLLLRTLARLSVAVVPVLGDVADPTLLLVPASSGETDRRAQQVARETFDGRGIVRLDGDRVVDRETAVPPGCRASISCSWCSSSRRSV